MELLEDVPGGLATVAGLAVILAVVVYGIIKKTLKLAAAGLVLFFALGGWAYVEAASDQAKDALDRAKDAAEDVEKGARKVEKKIDDLR